MQDFRKIRAWQANRELTVLICRETAAFPREERYGLTAQIRSASISIGANIAEGCGRGSRADTLRFFQIAFGSAVELLSLLIVANDLGYLSRPQLQQIEAKLDEARRMLAAFMKKLRSTQ
jgi:four helix bundle protein